MTQFEVQNMESGLSTEQQRVKSSFDTAIQELGAGDYSKFAGFVYEDSNLKAAQLAGNIWFNEKFLNMDALELERWSWHEVQHAITHREILEYKQFELLSLFVLHPQLADLHERMLTVYEKHKKEGFPFLRELKPIPANVTEFAREDMDYFHWSELLSLLRGYQCYLRQSQNNADIHTDPSEFIEAFKEDDLKLLNPDYRVELARWVKINLPEKTKPFVIKDVWE